MSMARARQLAAAGLAFVAGTSAWAGRPLAVDDASVNAPGHGHLESWFAHESGGVRAWNVGPAWGVAERLELGGLVSRDDADPAQTTAALQLKALWSASTDTGCNAGAVIGASRVRKVAGTGHYLVGLLSCNALGPGNAHLNLGHAKPTQQRGAATWGVAYEWPLARWTPHVEWFGMQRSRPTAQIGARTEIAAGLQLDGSIGRRDGAELVTLGLKLSF